MSGKKEEKDFNLDLNELEFDHLKLMGDFLLVIPFQKQEIKNFIIPENKKEKPTVGKVIKVGNGLVGEKSIEMIIKVNDIVVFNEWSGKSIDGIKYKDNSKLIYIKQSDVIAFMHSDNIK